MEKDPRPPRRARTAFAITLAGLVIVSVLGAGLYFFRYIRDIPGEIVDAGRESLLDITQAFNTGTVTTTFISYASEVSGSSYLQFATLKQVELFERKDSRATLWGVVELPDVVVQATAPVDYTYYLDLDGEWEMRLDERTVLVTAPEIEFNTPAIDASAIRYEVREGSVFRNEEEVLKELRDGLMEMSRQRAKENIELIRELGRRKTKEFFQKWLAGTFSNGADYQVEVVFRDELPPGTIQERVRPES